MRGETLIYFRTSMAKNHTAGQQLCGSVQDSINNLTIGKSIKGIVSPSAATATLASLDVVNWKRPFHKVQWYQLILVESFPLNSSETTKEKTCCARLLFINWAIICNQRNLLATVDTGRWSPKKVCRGVWKVRLIIKPELRKKSRWPIKDKSTGVMRHQRRQKIKDVTFCVRHIFIEKETIGLKTRTGYYTQSIALLHFVENPRDSFSKSAINRKGNSNADLKLENA